MYEIFLQNERCRKIFAVVYAWFSRFYVLLIGGGGDWEAEGYVAQTPISEKKKFLTPNFEKRKNRKIKKIAE